MGTIAGLPTRGDGHGLRARWVTTVRGTRVDVDVGLLVLAVFTAEFVQDFWPTRPPGFATVFLASLTASPLHEAGHFVFLKLTGIPVSSVAIGALSRVDAGPSPTPGHLVLRAIAGPAVNFVVAGLGGAAWALVPQARDMALALIIVHAVGALNLLPIHPLDGGHVVQGVVWATGRTRADAARWAQRANPWVIGALGAVTVGSLQLAGTQTKVSLVAAIVTLALIVVTARSARKSER